MTMNTRFDQMFTQAEGRYLSAEEIGRLKSYAASVEARLQAMAAIEQAEARIVSETLDEVWRQHPDFAQRHHMSREKCTRDVTLVLRYCTLAMVQDDETFLTDKLLHWMRTILHAFKFDGSIDTTYRALPRRAEANLDPRHIRLLEPYLRLTHQILTQP